LNTYVLDAGAILRYLENEPGAARVENLLNLARTGNCEISISAVNWGEILYVLLRKFNPADAATLAKRLRILPMTICPVGEAEASLAAAFKSQHGIPYADSFAGGLALATGATLVTADYDLKACATVIKIEFLPSRSGKSTP